MAYNTGNAPGSTHPKDLIDNAEDFDFLLTGVPPVPNRLGVPLKSWQGMQQEFNADQISRANIFIASQNAKQAEFDAAQTERAAEFDDAQDLRDAQFNAQLDASGFENPPLSYVDGVPLQVARVTQLVVREGILYTVRRPASFPYTLTGNWATDSTHLVVRADQSLRQDLADLTDPLNGVARVAVPGTGKYLDEILRDRVFPNTRPGFVTTSSLGIFSTDYTDDKSAELQAAFDAHLDVEIDTQIAVNNTVVLSQVRAVLSCAPSGIVLNGPDMAQKTMIKVTGHHAMVGRMDMDNPAMLKATSGGRQTAIEIQADYVTVRDCTFRHMLHAVVTNANGEWRMPVYFNNKAIDCIGVGAGASDSGSNGFGEDRGDAFTIWGATGVIAYNFASCLVGQDARIAFHCESLGNGYHTRPDDPARDGFDYWMVNNYAIGNFRRHFAFEAVKRGLMSGNVSGGGATWWIIAITGGSDCLAENMTVLYDRTSANNAGAAWSPARAAIGIGHNGSRNTMRNIEVVFAVGAVGSGLTSLVTNNKMYGVVLDYIRIYKPVGQGGIGFVLDNLPDVKSTDCHISGAAIGLTTFGAQDNWIKDFSAYDISGTAVSFTGGVAGAHARIEGGRLERVGRGLDTNNLESVSMRRVQLKNVTNEDFRQFGTTGAITMDGNHNENGTGKVSGFTSFSLAQVRYIGDNPGFTINIRYDLGCITNPTSALNTLGKYAGRTVVASNGRVYVATGNTPNSPWAEMSTFVTPV